MNSKSLVPVVIAALASVSAAADKLKHSASNGCSTDTALYGALGFMSFLLVVSFAVIAWLAVQLRRARRQKLGRTTWTQRVQVEESSEKGVGTVKDAENDTYDRLDTRRSKRTLSQPPEIQIPESYAAVVDFIPGTPNRLSTQLDNDYEDIIPCGSALAVAIGEFSIRISAGNDDQPPDVARESETAPLDGDEENPYSSIDDTQGAKTKSPAHSSTAGDESAKSEEGDSDSHDTCDNLADGRHLADGEETEDTPAHDQHGSENKIPSISPSSADPVLSKIDTEDGA